MKCVGHTLVILILGFSLACSDYSPTSPSSVSAVTLTATLLPANEVPPITNSEAGVLAAATCTFNLTKDSSGQVTAATMDVTVTATGFARGTALTTAHIHAGGAGTNGGVFVNIGLADGEVRFASGGGSFSKTAIAVPAAQANAIVANPSGFYFNIHTATNPDGVARGQLMRP